ncbi:MAG: helix-hairpin-helix domain-containing protein [Bacteroidota bacterium]
MNNLTSYFKFTKTQRSGILFLLLLIILLQCIYFFVDFTPEKDYDGYSKKWIAFQHTIDSLKQIEAANSKPKMYPFNPNYITDYKGYVLGMSTAEIDRLLRYRDSGKFINSAREFQRVTKISDSLLRKIQPWFTFPDWVTNRKKSLKDKPKVRTGISGNIIVSKVKKDLNTVTAQELKTIRGIGEVLSGRIVKFRKRLGGFSVDKQLYDVYGLSAEVVVSVLQHYTVLEPPDIRKINVNTASAKELSSIAYIRYAMAKAILTYREQVGEIKSLEELTKIQDFPIEKIDRIKLYLEAK